MKIKEPSEIFNTICKRITTNDIFAIITVFILGLINNFTFVITDGVAPDALFVSIFNFAEIWEISLGRFEIRLVDMMRFGLVNKFIIIVISLLFLAIAVVVITRTFKIKNKVLIFFISVIIAVAPQFTETYMFIYCADAYALAFLLAALTIFFLKNTEKSKWYYALAVTSTIVVCSLYQAYLGVILGLTIILLISYIFENMDVKEIIIKAIKYVFAIFVGVVLYYILLKIIIAILGISLASYKGANSLGIDTIKQLPKTILQTYKDFFNFFFTNKIINNEYWKRGIINAALFGISFIGLLFITIKNKYNNKYTRAGLLILLLAVFPIGVSVMNLIAPDTTINLVTGIGIVTAIVLVGVIYKNLRDASLQNVLKYAYIVMLLILTHTFILQNTFTYMCREQTYRNYYAVVNDIYTKATSLENYSSDKEWMFSDIIKYKNKYADRANGFISNNNETWYNYAGTKQNTNYFDKYMGIDIKMCSRENFDKIVETDEFKQMTVYPNAGSIKIINDIIVIKVSEQPIK